MVVKRYKVTQKDGISVYSEEKLKGNVGAVAKVSYKESDVILPPNEGIASLHIKKEEEDFSNKIVTRSFFFQKMYEEVGTKLVDDPDLPNVFVSKYDFFYDAVKWASQEGVKGHFYGFYSREDYSNPITVLEIAYWMYFLFGVKPHLDWRNLESDEKMPTCVLKVNHGNGTTSVNPFVRDYKAGLSATEYLNDIKNGKRYMPLPLYYAITDLSAISKFGVEKYDCFKSIKQSELDSWVKNIISLIR